MIFGAPGSENIDFLVHQGQKIWIFGVPGKEILIFGVLGEKILTFGAPGSEILIFWCSRERNIDFWCPTHLSGKPDGFSAQEREPSPERKARRVYRSGE